MTATPVFLAAILGCTAGKQPIEVEAPVPDGPAPAHTVVQVDTFHGVQVADPYRWLEDPSSPMVAAFSDAQNAFAEATLAALPHRAAIEADLAKILGAQRTTHHPIALAGGRVFAMRRQPPKPQPFLVDLTGTLDVPDAARVILDPAVLDADGLVSIDWFVPSPDGTKIAVSLSRGGSEEGDLHLYDVETLERIEDPIPRVNGGTAGGALAWDPDGLGFSYTRYPREGERPPEDLAFFVQLYHHTLGTPEADDERIHGEGLPRIAEIDLEAHHGTDQLLITVQDGDGGEFSHWLRSADGATRSLSGFGDRQVMFTFSEDGTSLYGVSFADAPRGRILRFDLSAPDAAPVEVVAEGGDTVVTSFWSTPSIVEVQDRLFVEYQTGGPSEVRAFDLDGAPVDGPTVPDVGTLGVMIRDPAGGLLFSSSSYVQPWRWATYGIADGSTGALSLDDPASVDLSNLTVERLFATSADGTAVPLNVRIPTGVTADGSAPCIVKGYGGYGVSLSPRYDATQALFAANGVVSVVANLRGGGEYGETWHEQGMLTHKQNVFDDFYAVVRHLADTGWCAADRTAIIGGSNGGLLMGAMITQHPDAVAAVVSSVGIYDMLRVELSPNGAFNVPEFGTVADPDHFAAMHAYSPYHNVTDQMPYPPVLFTTGTNDPRVDPMQSRKMTARLQAADVGGGPILLRTNDQAGHGSSTPLPVRIAEKADAIAFMLHHIGVTYTPLGDD